MSALFSPIELGPVALANRIVVSPMCQYSAIHGDAQDWHLAHLGQLAVSGAALVMTEAAAVEPEGRISHHDLALASDENEAALHRVIGFCRRHGGAKLGIQLAHAGRKGSAHVPWMGQRGLGPGEDPWETLAPSPIPFGDGWPTPRAATDEDLARLVTAHAEAARRAKRLGFDVIELHAAHGYLLHEFLSPISNQRTDAYGGSLENRMRLPLEIFEAIRGAVGPGIALGARITGSDWLPGGITPAEAAALGQELERRGCHYLDVTSGGLVPHAKIEIGPGYQVPFAEAVKRAVSIPVMSVGLIVRPDQAEEIVASGRADLVALARTILDDPRWPWHAAEALGAEVARPNQYQRAAPAVWPGQSYKGAANA
ncbi:MAG: NADH:flavin oxidoreductase/NADH oxidase [Methylobacteriaceae bacterium]|nr:NADH:flavin oxidoreductase/NADH oxidase [Methylobacteriaceae bacterium]